MNYINPYELLNITAENLSDIDSALIKKAKKHLLAEIQLNNDKYKFRSYELPKTVCNSIIDELDNEDKKRFHFYIYQNKNLNNFLTEGSLAFVEKYRLESIYNAPEFINFISPYFTQKFDKAILKAFQNGDTQLIKSILKYQHLINQSDTNNSFRSLDKELRNRIAEIDVIKDEITNDNSEFCENEFAKPLSFVISNFPIEPLNVLPKYFQSLINKAADRINYMQLEMGDEYSTKLEILKHIKELNIESVGKKTYDSNYEIVKGRLEEKLEQERNAPILKQWATVLNQIRGLIKEVDDKITKPNAINKKINAIVNISELNQLPNFGNEIKNQIGYAIRSLSISSWNAQNDIETAITLINLSLRINVSEEAKEKFESDLKDLTEIKKERDTRGEPIDSTPSLHTINGIGTTIYGDTLYFVFFGVPIIPLSRYNCSPTLSGYRFYGKLKLHNWQRIWQIGLIGGILLWIIIAMFQSNNSSSYSYTPSSNTPASNSYTPPSTNNTIPDNNSISSPIEPVYKSVIMKNGNMTDCSGFKPKYDYSINNKLIITAQLTDAVVKILDYETDKCIRCVFINDGTTYTAKNIPEGKYYLKIAYGNDWSVKEGDPVCKGHFASHALYKKDEDLYDFNKKHYDDGRVSIPYYTLKLYTTYSSDNTDRSSSPNSISENDFFNN